MFGQVPYGQIIFGQTPDDHPIILPAWKVQCPEEDGWFRLSQQKTVVEKCKPGATNDLIGK